MAIPQFHQIPALWIEVVAFYWTIGIFGTISALLYWIFKSAPDDSRYSRAVLAFTLALAFAPTLVPGISDDPTYNHIVPCTFVLILFIVGFTSRWTILLVAVIPLFIFAWLLFLAMTRRKKEPR